MSCCACNTVCNHVGPHAFCRSHAPKPYWYQPEWSMTTATTTTLDPRPAKYDRIERDKPSRMERLWRRAGERFGWL